MDAVPGVKQKLFSSFVPQLENWLQLPPQPPPSQKPTLLVADRQLVSGASMQVAPPLYTLQGPPQRSSILLEQNVTIVFNALRLERSARSPRGLPWKVTSESVVASQCLNCSMVIKLPYQAKWAMAMVSHGASDGKCRKIYLWHRRCSDEESKSGDYRRG